MSLQQEEQIVSVGGNRKASSLSVNVLILKTIVTHRKGGGRSVEDLPGTDCTRRLSGSLYQGQVYPPGSQIRDHRPREASEIQLCLSSLLFDLLFDLLFARSSW